LNNFKESGLHFIFSKRWQVLKYDEHRFYGYLSGSGFKGVDFIGILDQKHLVLMEVKNYHERLHSDTSKPIDSLLADPESFAESYSRKFSDTFQLIEIIRQYYARKWWYQRIRPIIFKVLPQKYLIKTNWGFWNLLIKLIEEKTEKINLVLWLELPPELNEKQKTAFHQTILEQLTGDFPPAVYTVYLTDSQQPILGFEGTYIN